MTGNRSPFIMTFVRRVAAMMLALCCGVSLGSGAGTSIPKETAVPTANSVAHFTVRAYVVAGSPSLSTNASASLLDRFTGPDVSLHEIVNAASALQLEYQRQGFPAVSIAFAPDQIAGGIVTFNVARTVIPQIIVAGERYLSLSNGLEIVSAPTIAPKTNAPASLTNAISTAATHATPPMNFAGIQASDRQMTNAMGALQSELARMEVEAKDTRVHVVSTNTGPRFAVEQYTVNGNTILPPSVIGQTITNIDGAFGTNVSFDGIETVVTELGKAYHERGYVTVAVDVPQQKLTNAAVKLRVLEGRLADIKVAGNRYFSSNNVMRSLPSLHTNMVLNGPVFNAELNRANANQDRQIYPVIGPGPKPGTSELTLNVKDRLPFHAKLEFNNQNSPGTPDMRVNGSAVYDNLWQREHSLGIQYGFSPEVYKLGNQWNFYDKPTVAYYSGFYRLPLGAPSPIANEIANNPGSFGYNEATRQFNLPPPSGQPELTFYANRATIDTSVLPLADQVLVNTNGTLATEQTFHQDITINEAVGFQLSKPLPGADGLRSILSGGLDLKVYSLTSYQTNVFTETSIITQSNSSGGVTYITNPPSTVFTPIPTTHPSLDYLPLSLNYSGNFLDIFGPATVGLGLSANLWYSSRTSITSSDTNGNPVVTYKNGLESLRGITSSKESTGHWVILRPSFAQQIEIYTNWITSFRADGQWASEPLISVEQFGAGGANSVRGYHEGEVFGDTGWHLSLEQQTPPYTLGTVFDGAPLTVRGSAYMDYARVYLIDPEGRQGSTPLWGTGFGFSAAAGSHWQAQFLFSWPLLSTLTTPAYQPFFNFVLTAQF